MTNRLFDVINDEPIVNAILINLGPFKELWISDTSEDKNYYKKYLKYIWYRADPQSPYRDSYDQQAERDIRKELFGRTNWPIPKKVEPCIEEYLKRNSTPEIRGLQAAGAVCDSITEKMYNVSRSVKEFERLIADIERALGEKKEDTNENIEERIKLMQKKLDLETKNLELAKAASDLIMKMKQHVEAMIELRAKAAKSLSEIEDSKHKVENFIVDNLINEFTLEQLDNYAE